MIASKKPAKAPWVEREMPAPAGVRLVRRSRVERVQGRWTVETREVVRWAVWLGDEYLGTHATKKDALDIAATWGIS